MLTSRARPALAACLLLASGLGEAGCYASHGLPDGPRDAAPPPPDAGFDGGVDAGAACRPEAITVVAPATGCVERVLDGPQVVCPSETPPLHGRAWVVRIQPSSDRYSWRIFLSRPPVPTDCSPHCCIQWKTILGDSCGCFREGGGGAGCFERWDERVEARGGGSSPTWDPRTVLFSSHDGPTYTIRVCGETP